MLFQGIKERISRAAELSKQSEMGALAEMKKLEAIEKELDFIEEELKKIDPREYEETVEEFKKTFSELELKVVSNAQVVANMTKMV